MSIDHSRISQLDSLIKNHGDKGIRTLLLFKLLKEKVKESLTNSQYKGTINENVISTVCVKKAIELAELDKQMPTEKDVMAILSSLLKSDSSKPQ